VEGRKLLSLLNNTTVWVDINKPPISDDEILRKSYDLEFSAKSRLPLPLRVNFRDRTVRMLMDHTLASVRNHSEKLQSLVDFSGAQLVIEIVDTTVEQYGLGYEGTLFPEVKINGLSLKCSGHELYVSERKLRSVVLDPVNPSLATQPPKHHKVAFVFVFPEDVISNPSLAPPG
jgi:hypothetical protein